MIDVRKRCVHSYYVFDFENEMKPTKLSIIGVHPERMHMFSGSRVGSGTNVRFMSDAKLFRRVVDPFMCP